MDERDELEPEVMRAREWAVLDALTDGVTVHDTEGTYLHVSPGYEELTGWEAADVVGRNPYDLGLFHDEDMERIVEVQLEALRRRDPWRVAYRLKRRDDTYVWVESSGRVTVLDGVERFVVSTRGASHIESMLTQIETDRQLKNRMREVVEQQQRFLTATSHRARTPLTAVRGLSEVLLQVGDGIDPDQRVLLLERLVANAVRLSDLLDVLTDADRLSRSDMVLDRRVVNLRSAVEGAVRAVADPAAVAIEVPAATQLVADRRQLDRMLTALLSNAVEHSGPRCRIWVRSSQSQAGTTIDVEDDGPGVPPSHRSEVFRPFHRLARDEVDPGMGLGLYLVAELAALHGGRVTIGEREGGGARFRLFLPEPQPGWGAEPEALEDVPQVEESGASTRGPGFLPGTQRLVLRILETVRSRTGLQSSYLTIFEGDKQVVLTIVGELAGLEADTELPLDEAYCTGVVAGSAPPVVPDLRQDAVAEGTLRPFGVQAYVGVPVRLPSGEVIGTLCCVDSQPRPDLDADLAFELQVYATILGDQFARRDFVDRGLSEVTERVRSALADPDVLSVGLDPIVELGSGDVTFVEAVPRFADGRPVELWRTDARRSGMLDVLEDAICRSALERLTELPSPVRVAARFSQQSIAGRVLEQQAGQHPDRLVVEASPHDLGRGGAAAAALADVRSRGAGLMLVDFGDGLDDVAHVLRLAPDAVRTAPRLTRSLEHGEELAWLAGLRRAAEQVGAMLVAAGVRRPATVRVVHEAGFTHAQGLVDPDFEPTFDAAAVGQQVRDALGC